MKVIYVAAKFRAPTGWEIHCNVHAAEQWGLRIAECGACPLMPTANTRNFHGLINDAFWIESTLELMRRCDAVFMCPGWENSRGCRGELDEANLRGVPVFYDIGALRHWLEQFMGEQATA